MNDTQKHFLDLMHSCLDRNQERSDFCCSDKEWVEILKLADIHQVFPMIFESAYLFWKPSDEFQKQYEAGQRKAIHMTCIQAMRTAAFLEFYQFLLKKGLKPIVMKGLTCRMLYPSPEQRPSADEDLLINEAEFSQYHKAFLEFGLHTEMNDDDLFREHEITYVNKTLYIELHKVPFPPESKVFSGLNRIFERAAENAVEEKVYGISICTMNPADHLLYQLLHAYKHFINCGTGIRPLCDILLYSVSYMDQIDWNSIVQKCQDVHVYDFVCAIYKIGERYLLRQAFPQQLKRYWNTEEIDELPLLEDVLAGGVYGTSNVNRLHAGGITIREAEKGKTGNTGMPMIQSLFPSLEIMQKKYSILKKHPILLPAAWSHRIVSYLSNHGNRMEQNNPLEALRIGNERVELMKLYHLLENENK